MLQYKKNDLLQLAKRINNSKRSYLLVNPLQAKHIPVSPSLALEMMTCLGKRISESCSGVGLVIGFAETATAVGAVVAKAISPDCSYIHTTREVPDNMNQYIYFAEEHSHAIEQKLAAKNLEILFKETDTVVFVDDEFSTGKTLVNMIHQLKSAFPVLSGKRIVAASIISRLSPDKLARMSEEGIDVISLLTLPFTDYTQDVSEMDVVAASNLDNKKHNFQGLTILKYSLPDPRLGVNIGKYYDACLPIVDLVSFGQDLNHKKVLVLGTEECMLPALIVGQAIENMGIADLVKCHATTRSPIGIYSSESYPIRSGYQIHSFYDDARPTFIYNILQYDVVFIISDTKSSYDSALSDLTVILEKSGCHNIICMVGEKSV